MNTVDACGRVQRLFSDTGGAISGSEYGKSCAVWRLAIGPAIVIGQVPNVTASIDAQYLWDGIGTIDMMGRI